MGLYGIYGEHAQEACPLYNEENRRSILKEDKMKRIEKLAQKYNTKFLGQYHSGLEHTFLWIAEADNAQSIEQLMMITAARFNTIKIVPLITFQGVIETCKKIEEGTFFPKDEIG
jgi:hypothetical protein